MASPFLIVRARGRLCALPLAQVIETLRTPPLEREPRKIPGWLGATMLRGNLVAVLDLGTLLGFPGEPEDVLPGRAVSVRLELGLDFEVEEDCVLLAVEEVIGVKSLEDADRQTLALPGGNERRMGRFDIGFARLLQAGGLLEEGALAAMQQELAGAQQKTAQAAVPV